MKTESDSPSTARAKEEQSGEDVFGKRIRKRNRPFQIHGSDENAIAALEVISRLAVVRNGSSSVRQPYRRAKRVRSRGYANRSGRALQRMSTDWLRLELVPWSAKADTTC